MSLPKADKRVEVQQRGVSIRRTINIPFDLDKWLEDRAVKAQRSVSNMVMVILHDAKTGERHQSPRSIEGYTIEFEEGGTLHRTIAFTNADSIPAGEDPRRRIGDLFEAKNPKRSVKQVWFVHAAELNTAASEWVTPIEP